MNQLSPIQSRDIHLSEFNSNPSREVGHDELVLMVEKNQEAALMGVQPKDFVRAAKLCFDQVDSHSGAISALLGNDQVFEEVARTLHKMKDSNDPVEERKAVAVALAALAGGQAMDVSSEDWPPAVRLVLRERWETSEKYWREKEKKFELQREKNPSVIVPISRKPFFSSDPQRLKKPCRFPMELGRRTFDDFHFVQAFLDHPKAILKDISAGHFSSLDLDQLEANSLKASRGCSQTMVHVVPENFGKLLTRLSRCVPKDGQRDFRGHCCLRGVFNAGHDMVVRLSKKPSDHPMVRVSVFMPCMVLGDTPHLKMLPEALHGLSFADFDISAAAGMEVVDILCLDVGDRELAQALAGQFVPNTPDLKISSLIHALSWGGLHELRLAASELSVQGFQGLNSRAKDLGCAIATALHFEHIEVLEELARSPLLEKLDAKTLEAMVWAQGKGFGGFPFTVQSGQAEVVVALGELLYRVKDRLPKGVAEKVLLNDEVAVELLINAPENVAVAYGRVIGKCLDMHAPSSMFTTGMSSIRHFLRPQKLLVKSFLLKGLNLPPHALNALLRGTQGELMLFLTTKKVEAIRTALELVIAVQNCGTKLDKSAASVLLKEIRFACQQPRFLCCGSLVNSDLFKSAIQSAPELHNLFKQAEHSLKS